MTEYTFGNHFTGSSSHGFNLGVEYVGFMTDRQRDRPGHHRGGGLGVVRDTTLIKMFSQHILFTTVDVLCLLGLHLCITSTHFIHPFTLSFI